MNASQTGQGENLAARLATRPASYRLLPALTLLEHFAMQAGAPPLGVEHTPAEAAVHLKPRPSLAFPASEVDGITFAPDGRAELITRIAGLLGHGGPLPDWVTEEITQRLRRGDRATVAFLHMFEQRLLTINYHATARTRLGAALRSPEASIAGPMLHALLGLGTPGMAGRLGIPDRALLHYTGLLAGHTRSAGALQPMLKDYLGVPVSVAPFTGRWLKLEPDDVTRLGAAGPNNHLGQTALIGKRIWDRQSCFTLHLGPLEPEEFDSLLPGGSRYKSLGALTRFFAGPSLDFHLKLKLRPHRIPRLEIRTRGRPARLGLNSFLVHGQPTRADGVIHLSITDTPAPNLVLFCASAMRRVMQELLPAFQNETGLRVMVEYANTATIAERLRHGAAADLAILSPPHWEALQKEGRVSADRRHRIAQAEIGVSVKKGTVPPDISTEEAFKSALLNARSIALGDPAKGSFIGAHIMAVLDRLGISAAIRPKLQLMATETENAVSDAVSNGAELGIDQLPFILAAPQVALAGRVPETMQNRILLVTAFPATAEPKGAALALVAFLASSQADAAFRLNGLAAG
jgi:type VI secretion system protein ImpH